MQIVIDESTVWLDDDAHAFLTHLKSTLSPEEVRDWLTNWMGQVIIPALLRDEDPELSKMGTSH